MISSVKIDTWWGLIERARATVGDRADDRNPKDDPLPQALVEVLTTLTPADLAEFAVEHIVVRDSAYRYPLWNAAYLIEGGCGDDGFSDFRDGLILLGRDTFTRAVADPDTLAELPVVACMARDESGWIGYESLSYLIRDSYRRTSGETDSLDVAIERAIHDMARPRQPLGDNWDAEDDRETQRRLPRLAALFLG